MLKYLLRLIGLFTATEPIESGAAPGEAPPADAGGAGAPPDGGGGAPPAADDGGQSLEDMNAGARARLMGDTPVEDLVGDDAKYRDVVPLREEIKSIRETFGPAAAYVESLPAEYRDGFLATGPVERLTLANPELASHLAVVRASWPSLDDGNQQIIRNVVALAATDPAGAIDAFAEAAAILQADPDAGAAGEDGEVDDFGFAPDDPNRPMTYAAFQDMQRQQEYEGQVQAQREAYTAELTSLGYHLDSKDPVERGLAQTVLDIAAELPDRSITTAHGELVKIRQSWVDDYVAGKGQDASRPQPTPGGAPPAAEGSGLETLEQMNQAARERIHRVAAEQS